MKNRPHGSHSGRYLTSTRQLGNDFFGDGNLGEAFDQFPIQHKCNMYCHWFKLENPSEILKKAAGSGPSQAGADAKKTKGKSSIVLTNYNSE